jgi:hypothetical protein
MASALVRTDSSPLLDRVMSFYTSGTSPPTSSIQNFVSPLKTNSNVSTSKKSYLIPKQNKLLLNKHVLRFVYPFIPCWSQSNFYTLLYMFPSPPKGQTTVNLSKNDPQCLA